ncbi:nitrous oxide reductase accessory protein NosL [Amphritea japonica]|uniref:Nitrous-oxide reductase maturation protein, outer-membrane lipoprotein NosL n=1 Tax=Amphritea japonica ATCC BAA-1530 TaxID=1278309 RepID=A0A7R6SRV3_9GAMM|nr:nitrous oxide reductase accessory protein NosL [Amphritea japonica]BBB25649.1 nitrous-oxide reductase maturation protein, outer-membrane lipoprotein NosL [Amphritea japonica ATCC BAA-1530]
MSEQFVHLRTIKSLLGGVFLFLSFALLQGCGEETEKTAMVRQAIAIESSDECHMCGMIITNFPGPKGQLYSRGISGNMRFCSTRDMFAFIVDPENQHNIQEAYVHDMAVTPWDHPDDETYIDAKKAFYVIGHGKKGAMGPTLASFSTQADADAFVSSEGGSVYRFEQITLELLVSMNSLRVKPSLPQTSE